MQIDVLKYVLLPYSISVFIMGGIDILLKKDINSILALVLISCIILIFILLIPLIINKIKNKSTKARLV
jgi:hypothetical protein